MKRPVQPINPGVEAARSYMINGMRYRGTEALAASLTDGEPVTLVRDANNKHDKNAVEMWARGTHVGFWIFYNKR